MKYQGHKGTPTYKTWENMKSRCLCKTNPSYPNYGGRGIKICKSWIDAFVNFLNDMGKRPAGTSIERIDNNGNYCKENCKWATIEEQARNKRNNIMLTRSGETMCVIDWERRLGLSARTINKRIYLGVTGEALFSLERTAKVLGVEIL